jgi:DNA-binding GntR family transcriptional regulator
MAEDELFRRITRQNVLVEDIIAQVSQSILSGRLGSGDKLVESRLAEQLGVSRIPVREALRKLEQLGLVEKIPYQGTFVSRLDDHEIIELHGLRKVLESMAVRLLAEKRDPAALNALTGLINKMQTVAKEGDRSRVLLVDAEFHDSLIHLTGHNLLIDAWRPVSLKLRRFLVLNRRDIYHTIEDKVPPHKEIVDAIRAGDPDLAEKAIQKHLSSVESTFSIAKMPVD